MLKKYVRWVFTFFVFWLCGFTHALDYQVAFAPNKNAVDTIVSAIQGAQKSIRVASYSFTSKPIANALYAAYKQGIDVKIVADFKSNNKDYSTLNQLMTRGMPVCLTKKYTIFHNKFMVIDNQTLETGSFNFTQSAQKHNAENVLVLFHVPDIANIYTKQWNVWWDECLVQSK
jgi:phosphatidylserine/phosphatidylglycerophosphate/cardiolipin synthase-like enzyme